MEDSNIVKQSLPDLIYLCKILVNFLNHPDNSEAKEYATKLLDELIKLKED